MMCRLIVAEVANKVAGRGEDQRVEREEVRNGLKWNSRRETFDGMIPSSSHWVASATAVSSLQSLESLQKGLGRIWLVLGGDKWQRGEDNEYTSTVPGTGGDGDGDQHNLQ